MVSSQNTERLAAVLLGISPPWLKQLLASTEKGEACLELGSGTGALSVVLALQGRKVLLLDLSHDSQDFAKRLFQKLGLAGTFIHTHILTAIPLEDDSCDCVWTSGVLEHFGTPELTHIMRESASVTRATVISLVPNTASVPYRLGK